MEDGAQPLAGVVPPLVDANVLLRYLTRDPEDLAQRAAAIIDGPNAVGVSSVSLAEAAHVLKSFYRFSREQIIDALIELVQKQNVRPLGHDRDVLVQGLRMCRPSGRVSIPVVLLWSEARSSGAGIVYTFDEQFPGEGIEVRA
jgi:predicted nucleic-acid-binding protein